MTQQIDTDSWIARELSRAFNGADVSEGVDLNSNEILEDNERIQDFNDNGYTGDADDWVQFFNNNQKAIYKLGGFFKWGRAFSPDNPIHDALSIEGEMVGDEIVQETYQQLAEILNEVKKRVREDQSPLEKMELVYDVMRDLGYDFGPDDQRILTLSLQERKLDCDTSSIPLDAVAHEMGWPIELVHLTNHVFARWNDGENRVNIDFGNEHPDSYYVRKFNLVSEDNPLLKGLNLLEVKGIHYHNRGVAKFYLGDWAGAMADFDKAIELNPGDALAYHNRGVAKFYLGDWTGAMADFDKAIELDPGYTLAYHNRGNAKGKLGDWAGAIADYDKAIELNPSDALAYNNRGNAKGKLGDWAGAIADYDKAIELNPGDAEAYNNRGNAKGELGDWVRAMADYRWAKELK